MHNKSYYMTKEYHNHWKNSQLINGMTKLIWLLEKIILELHCTSKQIVGIFKKLKDQRNKDKSKQK